MKKSKRGIITIIIISFLICFFTLAGAITKINYLKSNNLDEKVLRVYLDFLIIVLLCGVIIYKSLCAFQTYKYKDPLTDILNADGILRRGGMMYAQKRLIGYSAVFLNVKDFQFINQVVGNKNGDIVMVSYANKLHDYVKPFGYVGRMGGDNFLIFIKNEKLDDFFEFIDKIYITVAKNDEDVKLHVKARCGVFRINSEVGYRESITRITTALARAKKEKKDIVFFEDSMLENFVRDKEVLFSYKQGLRKREFVAYYQPKIDARTNTLCGAEWS